MSVSRVLVAAVDELRPFVDPLARLRAIRVAREELARLEQRAVDEALAHSYSYGDVGRALGISRQGARRRFAPPPPPEPERPAPSRRKGPKAPPSTDHQRSRNRKAKGGRR